MYCSKCNGDCEPVVSWRQMVSGGRHLEARCASCKRWLKWLPQTQEHLTLLLPPAPPPRLDDYHPPITRRQYPSGPLVADTPWPVMEEDRTGPPPTWADLAAAEPRLNDLLALARAWPVGGWPPYCRVRAWTGWSGRQGLKQRLAKLVGWASGHRGILRSAEAYEVAAATVYAALPTCRHWCGCLSPAWLRRKQWFAST